MSCEDVIELRIHGVSGTPPSALLDCPDVVRVAGDKTAGFYRPRLVEDKTDAPRAVDGTRGEPVATLEGYSWGGLTSGAPSRALWLLLLPFTLINVAPRMRPPVVAHRPVRVLWVTSRLSAVVITVLLVESAAGVGMDLFGWQCGRGAECGEASPQWAMSRLLALPANDRLLVGALVPLGVLTLLWVISGKTIDQYESITVTSRSSETDEISSNEDTCDADEPGLGSPWMWRNEFAVRRLRHVHLQAGFAVTLWIASGPMTGALASLRWSLCLEAVVVVALLCSSTFTGRAPHGRQSRPEPDAGPHAVRLGRQMTVLWGVWTYLAAYGVALALTLSLGHDVMGFARSRALPYYGTTLTVTVATLVVLTGVFAVTIGYLAMRARRAPIRPIGLGNTAGIMFAVFALFAATVFSAGFYTFATGWLTTGSLTPGLGAPSKKTAQFALPWVTKPACISFLVSVVALVVVAVVAAAWTYFSRRRAGHDDGPVMTAILADMYPGRRSLDANASPTERRTDERRARAIRKVIWLGRQVDYVQYWLAALLLMGVSICAVVVPVAWGSYLWPGQQGWPIIRWFNGVDTGWTSVPTAETLEADGAYLIVMTLVLLIALTAAAFRVPSTRKHVGVLWDIASFWPRLAHPFAAACYAERAVPDLTTRLAAYGHPAPGSPPMRVVVAGHSQGTVIGAAALFQLDTLFTPAPGAAAPGSAQSDSAQTGSTVAALTQVRLPWIAFLTFGSVLRRLFARYFPVYFGEPALTALAQLMSLPNATAGTGAADSGELTPPPLPSSEIRWRNLWRYSDYVGGKVMSGPPATERTGTPPIIDRQDVDPAWDRPPGDTRWPAAGGHSDFWSNATFQEQVSQLRWMLENDVTQPP